MRDPSKILSGEISDEPTAVTAGTTSAQGQTSDSLSSTPDPDTTSQEAHGEDPDGGGLVGPATLDWCQVCHARPARVLKFVVHVGKVLESETRTVRMRLCRTCGLSTFRDAQNQTMLKGWWHALFVLNFLAIARNAIGRVKVARMAPPQDPSEGALDPDPALSHRAGLWLFVPVFAAVFIAPAVVAVATSGDEVNRSVHDLSVGDCFNEPDPAATVEQVPTISCTQPHAYEVYATRSLEVFGQDYPGSAILEQAVNQQCSDAFTAFVGLPYQESSLELVTFSPTEQGWADGDRDVWCAVADPAGPVTGTLQGSQR